MDQAGTKLLRGLLEVFVLENLDREPRHGYALLKEMADAFGVEPNRNRLYPLLGRLVKEGWIREVNDADAGRTIYHLTEEGRAVLQSYRRLPAAFRDTVQRVWVPEAGNDDAPPSPAPAAHAPAHAATAAPAAEAPPAAKPAPISIPVQRAAPAPAPADAAAPPYPCADARVDLSKDPRSGALSVRVTGCPMGAYEYCPKCPVFHSVEGLRKIVFSL